ncbi:phosphotransferase [Dactylosporangium matsuzakiense]|uniref:phosphotransferase n=1 Tax=Dactylosporangium matsuzakiense TaxID=53360 RepID=UPI0021FD728E|nr:phosphotransferase [Dactylosporangium matsuzakiense]UWZ49855.1 phosphotransferase [Dactylosporangium matsuzakiense]
MFTPESVPAPPAGQAACRSSTATARAGRAFVAALPRYAQLQRATSRAVPQLLAAGVTDMRPSVLLQRFDEAAELVPAIRARRSWFADIAAALGASAVPAGLDHADLHEGNVFADGERFFDWGDSVVGHPFGSMLVALRRGGDAARDAYLDGFTDLAPRAALLEDLRHARIAANVIRALTWQRAIAADPRADPAFADGPAVNLRQLLEPDPWNCP